MHRLFRKPNALAKAPAKINFDVKKDTLRIIEKIKEY
jgi:hypothetical protein